MISKTAEYALRAAAFMAAQEGRPTAAEALAKKTKAPRRYLHRVLQGLIEAKLLKSRSGPGGGYVLAKPSRDITLLDIINAVDPLERIHVCPLGLKTHTNLCPLHSKLDEIYATTEKKFSKVTLQDLLDSTTRIIPLCEIKERV